MDILMGSDGVSLQGGKLLLTESRATSLAQRLSIRLKTHLESWFLNINLGIDYFNKVFEKTISKSSIDALFQAEIYKDLRVEKIEGFKSKIERNLYQMEFRAKAKDGLVSDIIYLNVTGGNITVSIGA